MITEFWRAGWFRKYKTLDNRNEPYVARIYCRLLDAEKRHQEVNKLGRYS